MKQIFSVADKGGHEHHIGSRVTLGLDKDNVRNYTVSSIQQDDRGWVLVSLVRIEEERRPKMGWSDINTGLWIPAHWVVNVTDLMEVPNEQH